MSENDRILVNGPLFHVGGTGAVTAALLYGGSIVLLDGFKASEFWQTVRETGSTMTSGLLGSMAPFLAKTASAADREQNGLRSTHFYPVSEDTIGLARQFGFEYFSGYGMTELPLVLVTDLNTTTVGSCGKARSGVECRLVDSNDCEVAAGEVGELVVRTDHTWSFSHGYDGMPAATAEAWRNGWYHTGDLLRQDLEGNFYFVDRRKDAIRRRGENISSHEVESAVYESPDVQEVAAFGVPGQHGEDEVMVVVVPSKGQSLDPVELFSFLRPRMGHYMLPRYIRVLQDLPRTPTDKIRKHILRDEGVTADTWDREAAGITVRRQNLD
jgi:crotonobetaine/carnitine-CoA ligase